MTLKKRISAYRKMIKHYEEQDEKYCEGICFVLGRILHKTFFAAPWHNWGELVEHFPELEVYVLPGPSSFSCFTMEKRKMIINSLKMRLNKKKDIYRRYVYKN